MGMMACSLVTVESGWPQSGIGAEVIARVMEGPAFDYLDAPAVRVTGTDLPTPYSLPLEDKCFPKANNVVVTVKKMLKL